MSSPTEQEIFREARCILRLLAAGQTRLVPRETGGWAVVQRGDPSSRRGRVSSELIKAFRSRGWLEPLPSGDLALSEKGRAWLAAELSGISPVAAQHTQLGLRVVDGETGEATVVAANEAESPLGWLRARGGVSDSQFQAGEKLRRDYTIARLEPRLAVDLAAPKVQGRGPLDPAVMPDAVLAAKQRFARALKAVGPGLSDLLFEVCCALRSIGDIEAENRWPRRSAKIVLCLALDRLADHYGLNARPACSHLRSWSAEFAEASGE